MFADRCRRGPEEIVDFENGYNVVVDFQQKTQAMALTRQITLIRFHVTYRQSVLQSNGNMSGNRTHELDISRAEFKHFLSDENQSAKLCPRSGDRKDVGGFRMIKAGSEFRIDRDLVLQVGNEYGDLLFKGASQACAGVSDFSADLDCKMIVTALEGAQNQVLARRIEREQCHVIECHHAR